MVDKKIYELHGKLPIYKRHIQKAFEIAKQGISQSEKPSLSFSGGKDSLVMLDIAVKCGFNGEIIFFDYGDGTPEQTRKFVIDEIKNRNLNLKIINCMSEFDAWAEIGHVCLIPKNDLEKKIINRANNDFKKKANNIDADMQFIGMRAEESKNRKRVFMNKGAIYSTIYKKSLTCCPIIHLSKKDIWAYIILNNLKYLDCYDYPLLSCEEIRNEPELLYSDSFIRYGMHVHYRAMFPDYMSKINYNF